MARADKRQRERSRRQRKAERKAFANAPLIDEGLHWHLARTVPQLREPGWDKLAEALTKRQVIAFRPRAKETVERRGRCVIRFVPLLHRSLIIGVKGGDHLDEVTALPHIQEIASYPVPDAGEGNVKGNVNRPARLDPVALRRFIGAVEVGDIERPTGLKLGDPVVVRTGPFAHWPGIVEEFVSRDRIKVGVAMFGAATPVELGIADVLRA